MAAALHGWRGGRDKHINWPAMSIAEAFERQARVALADHPELNPRWRVISKGAGRELFIPKQDASGFDVTVNAETSGLYPYAGDWHGAPWELSPSDPRPLDDRISERCTDFLGFVRTLLSEDASLEVHHAGQSAFRWILSYDTEFGRESEECGLLFYNYFGLKSVRTLKNRHLPGRYHAG